MVKTIRNTRYTLRRRHTYNTPSNKYVIKRTPGSRLVVQYRKKKRALPRAPRYLGGQRLGGIKKYRRADWVKIPKHKRTVSRPYGGVLTGRQVRERIIKAFLVEERKFVKSLTVLRKKQARQAQQK